MPNLYAQSDTNHHRITPLTSPTFEPSPKQSFAMSDANEERPRDGGEIERSSDDIRWWDCPFVFARACVSIWDLRLVDWANFFEHPSNGQTYGRSPVWIRTWVRKLKSSEKRLPHPSNVHCYSIKTNNESKIKNKFFLTLFHSQKHTWKGFSPVWTNWCRFNLLDSTNALPHSAQTWTRGPCVCRCFRIALLSRNILAHPLCGHAIVRESSSIDTFLGFILSGHQITEISLINLLLIKVKKNKKGYILSELG